MLQEILIEEHESTLKGKGVIEVPSPASVLHVDYLSDTCSRSSSQPTEESASSSTPGSLPHIASQGGFWSSSRARD